MAQSTRDLKQRIEDARALLFAAKTQHFHGPNTGAMEYCAGCGYNPYQSPPHKYNCLVPRIQAWLEE